MSPMASPALSTETCSRRSQLQLAHRSGLHRALGTADIRSFKAAIPRSFSRLLDGTVYCPHDYELRFRGRALSRFLDRAAAGAERPYSAIVGFFKTHELVYIGADERDLMTLRKVRNEQIQLYRLRTPPARARALLVEYIEQANDLAVRPRFYNTLTTNCTTTIFDMIRAVTSSIPFDWRIILTGHLPGYLYEHGAVDTRIPLEELRRQADVTSRVDASLSEVEFSSRLREGVPAPR